MKRTMIKTAGILFCSLALVLAGTSRSDACLLGWLFGCHCRHPCPPAPVPAFYPPACPTVCPPACPPAAPPVQTFYAPTGGAPGFAPAGMTAGYAPMAAPYTAGYAPLDYGVSYGPVVSGYSTSYGPIEYSAGFGPIDHGTFYGPAGSCANGAVPPPTGGDPRTFGDDQPPRPPGADDSQFEPREERRRIKPTGPGANGDYDDEDAQEKRDSTRRDTLRIDETVPDTIIPRRQPAPVKPPIEDSSSAGRFEKVAVRPLGLDEKITWRVTPVRTRLVRRPKVELPKIARTKADPNAGWRPVPEAKIARK